MRRRLLVKRRIQSGRLIARRARLQTEDSGPYTAAPITLVAGPLQKSLGTSEPSPDVRGPEITLAQPLSLLDS